MCSNSTACATAGSAVCARLHDAGGFGTHQEVAQHLGEEHVGEFGNDGVGAWSRPFHLIAQHVEDWLEPAAESTCGDIKTQHPREQTQPVEATRQRLFKDEPAAHEASAGSVAAVDQRRRIVRPVFGSTQCRHRGLTIGSDPEGGDALANFRAIMARAVHNQVTYQLRVPSRVGNRRPRAKGNPQQIHFARADRPRDSFHILHVVFEREIGPVTIGEAATVTVVQHDGPVFGKSPKIPGYAWYRAKPFEVAGEPGGCISTGPRRSSRTR